MERKLRDMRWQDETKKERTEREREIEERRGEEKIEIIRGCHREEAKRSAGGWRGERNRGGDEC